MLRYHHLVSLASMLGPSPDWIVGISSINLCLINCSWINEISFDLEPFDAGTDSGITYMVAIQELLVNLSMTYKF